MFKWVRRQQFGISWNLKIKQYTLLLMGLLYGCQAGINSGDLANLKAGEGFSSVETDKLFVVDCLLPGQIRRLGSQMTYLTSRRPIKTTAIDCEIRGGEYVAYDRANYASALKVWLPRAKQGDAEAQAMVGEIYQKGLGGMTDYKMALYWYGKAAQQGNSRAQVNLGYLYEKGLGVEKNLSEALNWYRKASGLENTDLEFASVTEAKVASSYNKRIQELERSQRSYRQETVRLRKQLSRSEQNLAAQQRKLNALQTALNKTRSQLEQEKNKVHSDPQKIITLERELRQKQSSIKSEKTILAQLSTAIQQQAGANSETVLKKEQLQKLKQELNKKEADFQDVFIRIKRAMNNINGRSRQALTPREKLLVEQMRKRVTADKAELAAIGKQISQIKDSIAVQKKIIARLEKNNRETISLASAGIEIIDPPMLLTRGVPSFQLRSIRARKKIVGKIKAADALKLLTVNGHRTEVDRQGLFQTEIPIIDDLNPVRIVAIYKNGQSESIAFNLLVNNESAPADDLYQTKKVAVDHFPEIDFGRFYALIIGNQDYTHLPSLKTSINDAREVDKILRSHYGYKTTLLINATRHQIMTALNDLRNKLTARDNLLIYYAGHGEIDKTDRSAYWLPVDSEPNNSANWLSSYSISQFLNIMKARHILVVADSCYSGAMTETAVSRLPGVIDEDKRKKWLQFMLKRRARTVLTSGGVQPVLDSGGGRHSIFAKAFLTALTNNNGLLEDYELYRAVFRRVQRSASQVGFQQKPQYSAMLHAGHQGSPYFFVPAVDN